MVLPLKIRKPKRGTPRLPIAHKTTLHIAARKSGVAHSSAPAAPALSSAAPAVADKHPQTSPSAPLPTPAPPTNLGEERLLTVKEAAYRLGKHPSSIREWLHAGRLRGWQPGGQRCTLMVSEVSVEDMLSLPLGFRK